MLRPLRFTKVASICFHNVLIISAVMETRLTVPLFVEEINDSQITVDFYPLTRFDLLSALHAACHTRNAEFPGHDDGMRKGAASIAD